MKIKKILFYVIIVLMVIIVYLFTKSNKINYVSIGDSIPYGENCYGNRIYGYSDYIYDYFKEKNILKSYNNLSNKSFSIQNLIDSIENNAYISNGKDNYKRILREADLVIVNIGTIDISEKILKQRLTTNDVIEIENSLYNMIKTMKKYVVDRIIAVGFYNPYPFIDNRERIDTFVEEINQIYKDLCLKNNITFVSIFDDFSSHDYIENPMSINSNALGHKAIFEKVKEVLDK